MLSTMMDAPLSLVSVLRHGLAVHGASEIVTAAEPSGLNSRRISFTDLGDRAAQLASVLRGFGIQPGDRVGTFMWNNQEHLEAYLAIPGMGAVLHTLNIRLYPEQLTYVVNHGADRVVIADCTLAAVLARVLPDLTTIEHLLVTGTGPESAAAADQLRDLLGGKGTQVHSYHDALAGEQVRHAWRDDIDERSAAAMCYTSGTTGNPKGVVYSHRSTVLHSMGVCAGENLGLTTRDRLLPIVPMFHANAWGQPYSGWMSGADSIMPDRFLQGEPLCKIITAEKPTISAGVPTIGSEVLRYAVEHRGEVDLSSLRLVMMGGAAIPRALIEGYQRELGLTVVQGWGMTETSPVAAISRPPRHVPPEEELDWRVKSGRLVFGVEGRIVDDQGQTLPADGIAVGEFEVRGPWVTGSYVGGEDPGRFHDGWLKTGDVGTLDSYGYMEITDRSKDVIKSGGEWISSVELENYLMAHPDVLEAAVVAVPDEKWTERPLASVVLKPGSTTDALALRDFLADRIARWQLPERWALISEVPKTSVGKFDKKVLRSEYAAGKLEVVTLEPLPRPS
jgi:fatty-acyl-CoA synthase